MGWYDNEWGYANQMLREALSVTTRNDSPPQPAGNHPVRPHSR
jgi:hypothetical protein